MEIILEVCEMAEFHFFGGGVVIVKAKIKSDLVYKSTKQDFSGLANPL